jgi:hypothetical protein
MPFVPCAILSLDIVDVTGVHMVNLDGRLHKHTLDFQGKKSKSQDAVSTSFVILVHICPISSILVFNVNIFWVAPRKCP